MCIILYAITKLHAQISLSNKGGFAMGSKTKETPNWAILLVKNNIFFGPKEFMLGVWVSRCDEKNGINWHHFLHNHRPLGPYITK